MTFEDEINGLNEYFFFKEFTYSDNKFKKPDGQEVEFADSIIFLDDFSFIFQIKERVNPFNSTEKKEKKWFKDKVIKKGTKQIRDTLSYIEDYPNASLVNNRGDSINIPTSSLSSIHKIVVHKSDELLPDECKNKKYHVSKTVGVIHIFQSHDYLGIVHYLITPAELSEYLLFRSNLIDQYGEDINEISELAILGQYLSGSEEGGPSEEFIQYLALLDEDIESWDMTGIIKRFPEKITRQEGASDYYCIVNEIAKLMRNELAAFRDRFIRSWEAAKDDKSVLPYRFKSPRTGCAFLFLPLLKSKKGSRGEALVNLTLANKYDLQSDKSLGVSFIADKDGWQDVEWCFVEEAWQKDQEIDKLLEENYPFRPVSQQKIDRYKFE